MKKNILSYILLTTLSFSPIVTFAALNGIKDLLSSFLVFQNSAIKVIFALAFLFFFWGMTQFILHAGEEKTREEGKKKMLWGIVVLFVMLSIFGILGWIGAIVEIPVSPATLPEILPGAGQQLETTRPTRP
ncbi:MAG: hypothetical protein HY507_00915 [Candidatus Zambryskibacteria bacterium]|nr:hypothetical protein [Candidatus Zambryskibacteria bacterium]